MPHAFDAGATQLTEEEHMHSSPPAHASCSARAGNIQWWKDLPAQWQTQAVAPVRFDIFHEYEMAADRTIGHDEDQQACYCALRYMLTELRSDDDDQYYEAPAYAESIIAWRLHDGRWLILRSIVDDFDLGTVRRILTFGASMPR
jgi:hypothetical protein